ncbi:FAD-binding oxidoreductase [Jannaschia aquimarina]|uniref:Putative FAD-linked oxidoreductase n=1 Tax=Jannaschia aquimarina TaxID=935700 RepID=A0A0D1EIQ9_9RHOB|nr:FAD-binding oxidoreductase [Jannaschia aquimarina]KIT17519.1 putative FAD-linked oxidoreductase [Jannaschia aquimarina]SNS73893.1 FAD/FMN-containing dehydrogenase [Jannaschia aquimarina]
MTDHPALDDLRSLLGADHVLIGADTQRFEKDWTGKWRAQPLAVVRPATTREVSECVQLAARHCLAVVPVGGNTGLVGGTANVGALMISLERMNRIREIRPAARLAIVEAGVILSDLHAAADDQDLVFPLTFGARGSAQIGGVLSTNAGGSNVVRYGSTRGLCLGLEVVLADGRVLDLMSELHKDNSGFDLRDLFIGAEGTLGLITAAILRLSPKPKHHATALLAVAGVPAALDLLNRLQLASEGAVEAFEYMPRSYMEALAEHRPDLKQPLGIHDHTVMLELGGLSRNPTPQVEDILSGAIERGEVLDATVAQSETQRKMVWEMREAAAEITFTRLPIVDNDICLPVDRVADFIAEMEARLTHLDEGAGNLIVAHLGDGNVHLTLYPTSDDPDHLDRLREMVEDVTVGLGGSISAEHGIGLSKLATMRRRKDPIALDVMRAIKNALDPDNRMNPGKVVPPERDQSASN